MGWLGPGTDEAKVPARAGVEQVVNCSEIRPNGRPETARLSHSRWGNVVVVSSLCSHLAERKEMRASGAAGNPAYTSLSLF